MKNNVAIILARGGSKGIPRKNLKNLVNKDDMTTSAILDGKIVNKNGQNVISYGEIVKTSTLRILSDVFKIKNSLTILRVKKKK